MRVLTVESPMSRITVFFERYTFWKITVMLALLFDTVSTIYFMQKGGVEMESHPLVRASAMLWGPVWGTFLSTLVFKAATSFFLEAFFLGRYAVLLYAATICTATAAGFVNFSFSA